MGCEELQHASLAKREASQGVGTHLRNVLTTAPTQRRKTRRIFPRTASAYRRSCCSVLLTQAWVLWQSISANRRVCPVCVQNTDVFLLYPYAHFRLWMDTNGIEEHTRANRRIIRIQMMKAEGMANAFAIGRREEAKAWRGDVERLQQSHIAKSPQDCCIFFRFG